MNITINKDIILQYTTTDRIFQHFLQIDKIPNTNISSPFTCDKNPSFKVYKDTGTYKCFSTGKQGDAFQLVADLYDLDCKSRFSEVLITIATELNLPLQYLATNKQLPLQQRTKIILSNDNNRDNQLPVKKKTVATEEPFKIDKVEIIDFEKRHLDFWNRYKVTKELLQQYRVNAIKGFSYFSKNKNKLISSAFTESEIAFSYEVNGNYEVYIPAQPRKKKFFCNGLVRDDIFGLLQLPSKVDNIIICAGKKDTIVAISQGFNAVTFRSETHIPATEQIELLQQRCNNLFVCYDNDTGGHNGVKRIIAQFPNITPLQLPNGYNDVADYFIENTNGDFQSIIDLKMKSKNVALEKNETPTIFHIAEDYFNSHYDLRYNTISLEIEIRKKGDEIWRGCNENSLWLELQKKSIKIPLNSLIAILKSDAIERYNPLINYFENLPTWDLETDYIKQFSQYVILDDSENKEQFEYHFKKWCVRTVKCATINNYFNKQAFVLTDDGMGQNIGKSSWCRFLCPPTLSNYLAEDMGDDKDSRILLCKNFLINLDELAALSKKEINQLKSYFSKAQINERLPYDRKNSIIPRVASFIGSTNMSTFLQDETGSVRWLCFIIKSINWNYKKEFDINNLWSQAYYLSNDESFDETLTLEDIAKNELRNDKFQIVSPEKDLLHKFFAIPYNLDVAEFLTATEFLHYISLYTSGIRLNSIGMGKALKSIGYKRVKYNGVYGYWTIKKPL